MLRGARIPCAIEVGGVRAELGRDDCSLATGPVLAPSWLALCLLVVGAAKCMTR
jgi:hypothetical protein